MSKPLLSIGIIFKNEIRCLERCVKSLQPLRDSIPCELVMADTGADDGSREIAEQYADILIDFPWVNDFSAARNAVIDQCSGKWYITMDADEWLDEDFSQLTEFLADSSRKEDFCTLVVRNYTSYTSTENYSDFLGLRMVRMSIGARYEGSIHEAWSIAPKSIFVLNHTILHHDGYVGMSSEQGRKKRTRNMSLLRAELKKSPNDIRRRLQCLESSSGDSDHEDFVRLAVEGVKKKLLGWDKFGSAIFRGAVAWAVDQAMDEVDVFAEDARRLFPDSMYTRLDIEYLVCAAYFKDNNYEKAIPAGEAYLQAIADYHAGRCNLADMMNSTMGSVSPLIENHTRLILAESYFQIKAFEKSMEQLGALELGKLEFSDFKNCIGIMLNLQAQSGLELSPHMVNLWNYLEGLDKKDPVTTQRMGALISSGAIVFPKSYREAEDDQGFRHAYTAFLPLMGKFEMGTAAHILETTDSETLEELLTTIKNWDEFPVHALFHAIECGACFPLPQKPLMVEEMDALAARLAQDMNYLCPLVEQLMKRGFSDRIQELVWTRALVLVAIQKFPWGSEEVDADQGMMLVHAFTEAEKKYLPLCYTNEAMQEENLFLLPALHRFGFCCVRAFRALEQGNTVEYVQLLRIGLDACSGVKNLVEFLLDHTPELQTQTPEPSAELRVLADQIRTILENFSPGDPAVTALKQSEAYQKVAYLIEGMEVPIMGGLIQ